MSAVRRAFYRGAKICQLEDCISHPKKEIMVRDQSDIIVKWNKTQRLNRYLGSGFVCLGCHKKIHRLGGMNNRSVFLAALEPEKSNINVLDTLDIILIPLLFGM